MPAFNHRVRVMRILGMPEQSFYCFLASLFFGLLGLSFIESSLAESALFWIIASVTFAYGFYLLVLGDRALVRRAVVQSKSDENARIFLGEYDE